MVPPPDETRESLDGQVTREGEPGSSQDQSLGEQVTGADAESRSPDDARSLGDQSTAGDMGSSVSDLDDLVGDLEDDQGDVVDLEARYEIQETLTLKGHSSDVSSVSFSPDGKRIVSGSGDTTLKVLDISSLHTSK